MLVGGWQRMMKPTSNTVLINGKQGAADQWRGLMGRRARLLLILLCLCSHHGEVGGGGGWRLAQRRAGFARRAAVKVCRPPERLWQRASGGPSCWSYWIFDWHSPPAIWVKDPIQAPPPHIKHNNVARTDWNSAGTPQAGKTMAGRGAAVAAAVEAH